jgi:hemoglobin
MIKRFVIAFCLLGAIAVTTGAQQRVNATRSGSISALTTQDKKSLYDRLGGYNAVAAVVDDFIGRLVADKRFTRFFVGHSEDSLRKIRQHIVDQFCAAAVGPCLYTVRDITTSHKGLVITGNLYSHRPVRWASVLGLILANTRLKPSPGPFKSGHFVC